jgi:hypothetical protein
VNRRTLLALPALCVLSKDKEPVFRNYEVFVTPCWWVPIEFENFKEGMLLRFKEDGYYTQYQAKGGPFGIGQRGNMGIEYYPETLRRYPA